MRLFHHYVCSDIEEEPIHSDCEQVYLLGLNDHDLFDDFFRPIARDGAGLLEIHLRLQKALHMLAELAPQRYTEPARRQARLGLGYAEHGLVLEEEREQVRGLAAGLLGQNEGPVA